MKTLKRDYPDKSAIFNAILIISLFFGFLFFSSPIEAENQSLFACKQKPKDFTSLNRKCRGELSQSDLIPSISVGRAPTQAVISGSQAYIVCFGDESVWVVDLVTKSVTTVIPVGALPEGISVSKDGNYVYVASLEKSLSFPFPVDDCSTIVLNPQGGKVTVINTFSNSVESVVPIPQGKPFATFPSFDGKKLYVITTRGSLHIIGLMANVVEKEIHLGVSQAENAVLSPDGKRLFVSAEPISNDIIIFHTLDSQIYRISLDGTGFHLSFGGQMAVDPSGEYLIANAIGGGNCVTVFISTSKENLAHVIPERFGSISFSNDGTKAYLVSSMYPRSSGVIFNLETFKIEKYLPVGGVATLLTRDESGLFVLRYGGLYRRIIKMGQFFPFQYDITLVDLNQNTAVETPISSDNIWCSFERNLTGSSDGKYLIATNSALNTVTIIQTTIIYAPLNFSGLRVQNRSLSQFEYINILNWQANPNNKNIIKYRIYQIDDSVSTLLIELSVKESKYWHRKVKNNKSYSYALAAVNAEGREGFRALTTVEKK